MAIYVTPLLESTVPAGVLLAGHTNIPEKVNFPELTRDLPVTEWEDVIDKCYEPISLKEFKKGERLRGLLHVCLASTIRYHQQLQLHQVRHRTTIDHQKPLSEQVQEDHHSQA
jgi:hypothetical protein